MMLPDCSPQFAFLSFAANLSDKLKNLPNKKSVLLSSASDIERSFTATLNERCYYSDTVIVKLACIQTNRHAHTHALSISIHRLCPHRCRSVDVGQYVCRWVVSNACIGFSFHELIQWASQLSMATPERPEVQLFIIITDNVRLRIPNSIKVCLMTAAPRFRVLWKSSMLKNVCTVALELRLIIWLCNTYSVLQPFILH